MHSSDQRSSGAPEGATTTRGQELSRRTVLKIAGSALAVAAGCGTTGAGEVLLQTEVVQAESDPRLEPAVAVSIDEARHRRHRLAYLTRDTDPVGDTCELGCTGFLHDHEYGGTSTWH